MDASHARPHPGRQQQHGLPGTHRARHDRSGHHGPRTRDGKRAIDGQAEGPSVISGERVPGGFVQQTVAKGVNPGASDRGYRKDFRARQQCRDFSLHREYTEGVHAVDFGQRHHMARNTQ